MSQETEMAVERTFLRCCGQGAQEDGNLINTLRVLATEEQVNHGRRTRMLTTIGQVILVLCLSLAPVVLMVGIALAESPLQRPKAVITTVNFGMVDFLDDDLAETYGLVPLVGLRFSRQIDERAEWFLQIGYGADEGDPYYGTPDFRSPIRSNLQMVPLDFGFRVSANSHASFRFYVGLAVRSLWVVERRPSAAAQESREEVAGWGWGFHFLIGPEWRLPGQKVSIGLQMGFGPQEAELGRGWRSRSYDFTGLETRGGVSISF